jgi:hypothetical protein
MNNILKTSPFTRINDNFNNNGYINSSSEGIKNYKHKLVEGEPNDNSTRYQASFYQYIAVDLVVETVLNYPYAYVSEKTLRPIACKRMFIILGACSTLQLLQDKGFLTFDDFIDESYDKIQDPIQRFIAVKDQVYKICNTPLQHIKNYIEKNTAKFEHNFLLLSSLQDLELQKIAKDHDIKI